MVPNIKAVAFDLDGTLYPNYRLYVRLLPFLLKEWRFISAFGRARDQIRGEQEQPGGAARADFYDYQARLTAERLNAPPEQTREKIEKSIYRAWEPYFTEIKMFPHVLELLEKLKEAKLKLGLLSDFPPAAKLENLGIAACFDAVLCSESIGALKPALPPFLELAKALGCAPEQVLYVGNSRRYDIEGGRRAGMKTALLKTGLPGTGPRKSPSGGKKSLSAADLTFSNYRQLADFVLQ